MFTLRQHSEFPWIHEQDSGGRRRRPVVLGVVAGGIAAGSRAELLDAPDVLVAGELGPVRHDGRGRVLGAEVGRQDGARRVLAGDVVRVVAQGAEQGGAGRAGHAEAVEEVRAEGAEDVRDGGDAHPRRAAVERPERGERRAEHRRRAAHAEAHGAGGVPDAEHGELRWEGQVRLNLDGEHGERTTAGGTNPAQSP